VWPREEEAFVRIAVVGAGGVGGYLAGRLAEAGTAEVGLVARGRHLAALREGGLRVRSVFGDLHVTLPATEDPATIGPVDAVVFTVKSTDTAAAAAQLAPLLDEHTAVITFQNGVDNPDRIAEVVGADHVLGGVALIFSTIQEPGVIDHTGGPTRFIVGELDGRASERAERFVRACTDAGVTAELTTDIRAAMWRKLAFICAQSGMTAASRLPVGALRADPAAWTMFRRMVDEVCAVAAAEGVGLPEDTAATIVGLAEGLDPGAFSSLHHDLTHGKPLELDALQGTVVRRGHARGVPVPMHDAVHALLSPWAAGVRETPPRG
jgi:2-dehydropantoate 2-reductase